MSVTISEHRVGRQRVLVVRYRDLVVIFEQAVAERFEDRAHSDHAEVTELRGAQCAHAAGAEDVDTFGHGPQDLFVPGCRHPLEVAVDDGDGGGPLMRGAVDIPESSRPCDDRVQARQHVLARQRRPGEDVDGHDSLARTRAPGVNPGASCMPSRPGTTTLTTGI